MSTSLSDHIATIATSHGYHIEKRISGRGRYEYAVLTKHDQRYFLKAGLNQQVDLDEPIILHNLQREVWWAQVVSALNQSQALPFTSPPVVQTNIQVEDSNNEEVGWIIYTYETGEPLSGVSIWETTVVDKEWQPGQIEQLKSHIPDVCAALVALNSSTPQLVSTLTVPNNPPHPPHYESHLPEAMIPLVRQEQLLEDKVLEQALTVTQASLPETRVLGQGDFEVSHIFIRPNNTIVISENEFAGWYPPHDSLTYCFHRLWANRRRPDLAQMLLSYYVQHHLTPTEQDQFWVDVTRLLVPRVVRGMYYDFTRRQLSRDHANHQLRRTLLNHLLTKQFKKLLS